MERIFITGGAGFIGSHTCLVLLKKGYEVVVLDSFVNSYAESLRRVKKIIKKDHPDLKTYLRVFKGDIRDVKILNKIFLESHNSKSPIKGVIHFAGLKSVKNSVQEPSIYWENNVDGSKTLIGVMEKYGCKVIVFSSSATIYGTPKKFPITESSEIRPLNPYGETKAAVEKHLEKIHRNSKGLWSVANLRYFNPIGAHSSGILGESSKGLSDNIFPLLNRVADGKMGKIKIFGGDWPTHDGTCIRDYIHVMDLAEGHLESLEYLFKKKSQIINLNLGCGIGTSVLDLINVFERVNKVKINYEITKRRRGDTCKLIADNRQAQFVLAWYPKRNLEIMCRDGWKWQKLNPNGYFKKL